MLIMGWIGLGLLIVGLCIAVIRWERADQARRAGLTDEARAREDRERWEDQVW